MVTVLVSLSLLRQHYGLSALTWMVCASDIAPKFDPSIRLDDCFAKHTRDVWFQTAQIISDVESLSVTSNGHYDIYVAPGQADAPTRVSVGIGRSVVVLMRNWKQGSAGFSAVIKFVLLYEYVLPECLSFNLLFIQRKLPESFRCSYPICLSKNRRPLKGSCASRLMMKR